MEDLEAKELVLYLKERNIEYGVEEEFFDAAWINYNHQYAKKLLQRKDIDFWKRVIDFSMQDEWLRKNSSWMLSEIEKNAIRYMKSEKKDGEGNVISLDKLIVEAKKRKGELISRTGPDPTFDRFFDEDGNFKEYVLRLFPELKNA